VGVGSRWAAARGGGRLASVCLSVHAKVEKKKSQLFCLVLVVTQRLIVSHRFARDACGSMRARLTRGLRPRLSEPCNHKHLSLGYSSYLGFLSLGGGIYFYIEHLKVFIACSVTLNAALTFDSPVLKIHRQCLACPPVIRLPANLTEYNVMSYVFFLLTPAFCTTCAAIGQSCMLLRTAGTLHSALDHVS